MAAQPVRVQIGVDTNTRDMTYSPSVLHANPGETIEWTSVIGEFTLMFTDRTPFTNGQSEVRSRPQGGNHVGHATVDPNARGASYRYQVAVHVQGSGVFIDPGCGEVIVPR